MNLNLNACKTWLSDATEISHTVVANMAAADELIAPGDPICLLQLTGRWLYFTSCIDKPRLFFLLRRATAIYHPYMFVMSFLMLFCSTYSICGPILSKTYKRASVGTRTNVSILSTNQNEFLNICGFRSQHR
jgi:hypothetical protein